MAVRRAIILIARQPNGKKSVVIFCENEHCVEKGTANQFSFTYTFKKFLRCEINRSNNVLTMYIYYLKLPNGYPL